MGNLGCADLCISLHHVGARWEATTHLPQIKSLSVRACRIEWDDHVHDRGCNHILLVKGDRRLSDGLGYISEARALLWDLWGDLARPCVCLVRRWVRLEPIALQPDRSLGLMRRCADSWGAARMLLFPRPFGRSPSSQWILIVDALAYG